MKPIRRVTRAIIALTAGVLGDIGVPRTVVGGVVVEGVDEEFEERIKQLCR